MHLVAEIALVVLLFIDAAQIDLKSLQRQHAWPQRMLLIGLPLAILIGTVAMWGFLPDWPIFAIVLAAAILAPDRCCPGTGRGHEPGGSRTRPQGADGREWTE